MPAGRSAVKSYAQVRLSTHRAAPLAEQSMANGSVVTRGSPSGTIGSAKRAVTCRTRFTVPCGANSTTRGSSASVANAANAANIRTNTSSMVHPLVGAAA
jgi:hypothetical protein